MEYWYPVMLLPYIRIAEVKFPDLETYYGGPNVIQGFVVNFTCPHVTVGMEDTYSSLGISALNAF